MEHFDSEKSIEEIEFSKKSSSSSSEDLRKNANIENEHSQSDQFRFYNKFSESSDKSALMSIEKAAYARVENHRNIMVNDDKVNKDQKSLQDLQLKATNLQDFLVGIRKNLENERKISNKNEEIINLNSRLDQLYNENQVVEEKVTKSQATIKILNDEYNKCLNKILELEFANKQLHDESHSFRQKLNEISGQNQSKQIKIEEITLENTHLKEKIKNLSIQSSNLIQENNEKNVEIMNFANFKRKVDIMKEHLMEENEIFSEERYKIFFEQNDFIRLMKLLIKERTNFLQEIQEQAFASDQINKLNKCLEIQNRENRVLIEDISSQKKINDQLMKNNFELEEKVFKLINELEDKKARETIITTIIQDHTEIKMEMDRKDKIVSEILLLVSFYEQIRLAYQGKINEQQSYETNLQDVQNLLAYSIFKEDLKNIQEKSKRNYPDLIKKIQELFQEKKIMNDQVTQYEVMNLNKFTQVTKEDGVIPYEEIQRENEKIKKEMEKFEIGFEENVKLKAEKLKQYVEKLFGWRLVAKNDIIRLENVANNFELYFLNENNEISLLNKTEMLGLLGNPPLNTIPEILSYFTMM